MRPSGAKARTALARGISRDPAIVGNNGEKAHEADARDPATRIIRRFLMTNTTYYPPERASNGGTQK